ncbi:hypothetical protein CVM73_11660 [Bradyrhizobium forestalis]|uniref:Uncharacterized protein n=1 Tax=Bradyrhizobium forestalis TaxID=1419263 RepID=A0A2M8RBK0_9BRAD|nr:hypothetical protein CVM73_11660 [Bradyrhizobium forestalis]
MVDALARGQSAEGIVDDFPSLTRIRLRRRSNTPRRSQARVSLSLAESEAAPAELAGLGFDDEAEAGEVAPRRIS